MGNLFLRKAENACLAPTTTGRTDKRALFALEGGSEVVEELAFGARQKKSGARSFSRDQCWRARIENVISVFDRGIEATSSG